MGLAAAGAAVSPQVPDDGQGCIMAAGAGRCLAAKSGCYRGHMEAIVLDDIAWQLDVRQVLARLHLQPGSEYAAEATQLASEAQAVARPRAMYGVAFVDEKGEDGVVVEGVNLNSRVLRVNLGEAHRIFPYVATCGCELDQWSESITDVLHRFWADSIKEMAIAPAMRAVEADLQARFQPGKLASMNPGSLPDWPLTEQAPLFQLLGDVYGQIGVRLTDSYLMLPTKSVSGLFFPTEVSYANCQLCPRASCPGRSAAYEPDLFERKYSKR